MPAVLQIDRHSNQLARDSMNVENAGCCLGIWTVPRFTVAGVPRVIWPEHNRLGDAMVKCDLL